MRYQAALRPDCSTNTAVKIKFKGYISYKFIINLIFNAIRVHMIIECPNCNKKFNLDEKLIPENGRTLKCSSCAHVWHHKIVLNENKKDQNNQPSFFLKTDRGWPAYIFENPILHTDQATYHNLPYW